MITEIISYNAAWFVAFAMSGMVSGIMWAWNRKILLVLFVVFAILLVVQIMCITITPVERGGGFSNVREWYYFIGSMCGGLVWKTMFDVGKNVYENAVIK